MLRVLVPQPWHGMHGCVCVCGQPDATVVFDATSEGVTIEFPLLDAALQARARPRARACARLSLTGSFMQGADNVSKALCLKVSHTLLLLKTLSGAHTRNQHAGPQSLQGHQLL
jgi:hypothetical protein